MTKYTVRVCDILRSFSFPQTNVRFDKIIEQGKEKFFDFDFPWYAEDGTGLNDFKILFLETYYTQQIGFETYELFQLNLSKVLKSVMHVYKEKYKIVSKNVDYLSTHNLTESSAEQYTGTQTSTNTDTSVSKTKTDTQDINSDNPDITIQTQDYASSMSRGESVSDNNTTSNGKTVNDNESNNNVMRDTKGYAGVTPSKIISEFKENIININKELVDECSHLFMGLWG